MIHVRALRGFVPADLFIDVKGYIPLPGDDLKRFEFFWETTDKEQRQQTFACWCLKNITVIGRTLQTLARWKAPIDCFQQECAEESARRRASFRVSDLWKTEIVIDEAEAVEAAKSAEQDHEEEEADKVAA